MTHLEVCTNRYLAHRDEQSRLERLHGVIGNGRLAGTGAGLALLWLVETTWPSYTWPTVLALAAAFVCSSIGLSRVESRIKFADLARIHHARLVGGALAVEERSERPGALPDQLGIGEDHPFALDIDVLQPNGLLDKTCLAASLEGIRYLAELLTTPAKATAIKDRQAAIRELLPELDLREQFHVEGFRRGPVIRTDPMLKWAAKERCEIPTWMRPAALAVSLAAFSGIVALGLLPSVVTIAWTAASVAGCVIVRRMARKVLCAATLEAEALDADFSQLLALVRILEPMQFESPELRGIVSALRAEGSASEALERFRRIITLYEARRNQFVAILGPVVLYGTQLSLMVEAWRSRHADDLPKWIRALARFEALSSLAGFAFVREHYVFPELSASGPLLQARDLGHPLLGGSAVGNDVSLDPSCPVLVVSGANMAGKSTLLRTIGANMALAYAGAPVQAASMTMSDLVLVTSIRVTDSLQRGESRFSAELQRIGQMLDSVRQGRPTLILIDELFGGTNSFDRYSGAVALVERLLESDSVLAVLSTHDRHVTRWAEGRPRRIANLHFRDEIGDGKMEFDYKLHDGPATRGNAVELMRLAGLRVRADLPAATLQE